jgi:hypothetical protein
VPFFTDGRKISVVRSARVTFVMPELTSIITTGRRGSAVGSIPPKEPSRAPKEKR